MPSRNQDKPGLAPGFFVMELQLLVEAARWVAVVRVCFPNGNGGSRSSRRMV